VLFVSIDGVGDVTVSRKARSASPHPSADGNAAAGVTALYVQTAVGLIRLAYVILSDRQAAEDVVQDAFVGLYSRWGKLADPASAEGYLRASVLNGCRSMLRRQAVRSRHVLHERPAASADVSVFEGAERCEVERAVDRLPPRQREALVLRYYLNLPDEQIARLMGIRPVTVRATVHRALEGLGRALREDS
jgi:RNA polymerase sigma-70 factor (sigma-E family)